MRDYGHKKIVETIIRLDAPPCDAQAFAEWIKANAHLAFLRDNADADEVVVYASGEYTFIHSLMCQQQRPMVLSRMSTELSSVTDGLLRRCNAKTAEARRSV